MRPMSSNQESFPRVVPMGSTQELGLQSRPGSAGRAPMPGLCVILGAGCPQFLGAGGGKSLLGEGA